MMSDKKNSALMALIQLAEIHALSIDARKLEHAFADQEWSIDTFLQAAQTIGLKAEYFKCSVESLFTKTLPTVARDQQGDYFVILALTKKDSEQNESSATNQSILKNYQSVRVPISDSITDYEVLIQYGGSQTETITFQDLSMIWSGGLVLAIPAISHVVAGNKHEQVFKSLLKKYWVLFAEVLVISLFLQLLRVITPQVFQVLLDKVFPNQALQTLQILCVGLVAYIFFFEVLRIVRGYLLSETGHKITIELGARVNQHLLRLPLPYFNSTQLGQTVNIVREIEEIRLFLSGKVIPLIFDNFFIFILLVTLGLYNVMIASIALVAIALCMAVTTFYWQILKHRIPEHDRHYANNLTLLIEAATNSQNIKTNTAEIRWQVQLDSALASLTKQGLKITSGIKLVNLIQVIILNLAVILIIWIAGNRVIEQAMSFGIFMATIILVSQLFFQFYSLAERTSECVAVGKSIRRLESILSQTTEERSNKLPLASINGSIEFERTTFRYGLDASDTLRNLNLKITPGERIGILGESGSGKTTLGKLLLRAYQPSHGRVLIDGHDIHNVDLFSLRHQIASVSSDSILFNKTIRENINVSNSNLTVNQIIEIATIAGAHEFICNLPEGYDTVVQNQGASLSLGERRLISLAQALAKNPRILIFDDFWGTFDPQVEKKIQDRLVIFLKEVTTLTFAQRISALGSVDRIAVIRQGEIKEIGSHHDLLLIEKGIYKKMYQLEGCYSNDSTDTSAVLLPPKKTDDLTGKRVI